MATLVFSAIGSALGGPMGGMLGGFIGREVDSALFGSASRRGDHGWMICASPRLATAAQSRAFLARSARPAR